MAWGQVNRLGVGGNYVCCLVIVVIYMTLGEKRGGAGGRFIGELIPSYSFKITYLFQPLLVKKIFDDKHRITFLPVKTS